MWDIVWVSPQGHRSVSVSRHFLLQAPQCPCSVLKRFSRDNSKQTNCVCNVGTPADCQSGAWSCETWGGYKTTERWLCCSSTSADWDKPVSDECCCLCNVSFTWICPVTGRLTGTGGQSDSRGNETDCGGKYSSVDVLMSLCVTAEALMHWGEFGYGALLDLSWFLGMILN